MTPTPQPVRGGGTPTNRLDHLDPTLYARWVRVGTALTAVGYGVITVVGLAVGGGVWSFGMVTQVLAGLCGLMAWILARQGRLGPAAYLAIGAVWVEAHSSVPFVGLATSGLIVFPVLVMATGILMRGRGAFLLAAVTSVTLPLTEWIGFAVRGVPVPDPARGLLLLAIVSLAMFAAAALVGLGLDSFDRVLYQAVASEERVSVLIAHAPVGILVADRDGFIASVNPTAESFLSADAAHLRGKPLLRVLDGAFPDSEAHEKIRTLMEGDDVTVPLTLHHPERIIELEALATPLPWADGTVGTQVILRDVTERRRAEENQRFLQAQLEHAQRLEAVGRLAGGVAHDFNNLLTVIGVSSEMLLDESEGHTQELARGILDAKVRGMALTKQLLAFARKDPIDVRPVSLSDVLRDNVSLLRRFLTEDVELVVDAEGHTPQVLADPAHVEQVLANLVINARDALGARGCVKVAVHPPGSTRSWAGREEWVVEEGFVELSVEDNGAGMDPEVQSRIFEPFFTTKPRGRGTGLGLASVHGIMNQNGGKIRVLTQPKVGTCFLLYWPVASNDR